jgi:hypothetical protein
MPTTVCQKPPSEYERVLVDFVLRLQKIQAAKSFTHIYACDETAFYLDASNSKCVEIKGAKEV